MTSGPDERLLSHITDWHEELLIDLLNRRPGRSVHDHPEWFDDGWPEPYIDLVDLGLVNGIEYSISEDGGLELSVGDVSLTEEGRRVAEAARRKSAIERKRVFVSYVHDDSAVVDQLCADLENAGIHTWRDIDQLKPGDDWKITIRRAIQTGTGFIACFSRRSEDRSRSYMREELVLAIEELRQRPTDSGWFMPVVLDDVTLPDISIGAGRTLKDLHFVRWQEPGAKALQALLEAIDRLP
jgi:hypothetical protein